MQKPRLLYPARTSFRFEGEIKSFTDKQKLKEFSTTKPAFQKITRLFSRQEAQKKKKKRKKERKKENKTKENLQKETPNNRMNHTQL